LILNTKYVHLPPRKQIHKREKKEKILCVLKRYSKRRSKRASFTWYK